jgi:xanthine dehydrogenase accessory factor
MEKFMDVISRVYDLLKNGETLCLATIVESGERDAPPGRKAIVLSDGSLEGSLGSDPLDNKLLDLSPTFFNENKSRTVNIENKVRVFINILTSQTKLLICGAGHIAIPLAQFAHRVGFHVTVLDDRPDFAHPSRFPNCEVMAEDFTETLRALPLSPSTYVVVITRGHEHDAECLAEILKKETAYVGLIGSRRRVRFVLEMLCREGILQERLNKVFTPIGLPIGAESPDEIALSIISELVCVRRKGSAQARTLRAAVGMDL